MRRLSQSLALALGVVVCIGAFLNVRASSSSGVFDGARQLLRSVDVDLDRAVLASPVAKRMVVITRHALSAIGAQPEEPFVRTDQSDYMPGETVYITGWGFKPGEKVTLQVLHVEGAIDGGAAHDPWDVDADEYGFFEGYWLVYADAFGGRFLLTADGRESGAHAETRFTDANPSADLDQCANDPSPSPNTDGCSASDSDWVNGNLGESKSSYVEGDSIPYRLRFDNLALAAHTVDIEWDTTKGGKHAIDYITTFNRTVGTANPCLGVSGCGAFTTFPIPFDGQVDNGAGSPVAQIPGVFRLYGGTITSAVYSYPDGAGFVGDKSTQIRITFNATVANPVLAWGGHIATRPDWGAGNSAIAVSGSPYHTRLIDLDGSGGNQDRSLSAAAVFFPADLTIKKITLNESGQPILTADPFDYLTTGTGVSDFTLNTSTQPQRTFVLADTSIRTVTEADPSPEYVLTALACVVTPGLGQGGTANVDTGTRTATIEPGEGDSITCTYTNKRQGVTVKLVKDLVPDSDTGEFDLTINSTTAGPKGDGGFVTASVFPGDTINLSEAGFGSTSLSSYTSTLSCDSGITLTGNTGTSGSFTVPVSAAGTTITCTVTNTRKGTIVVVKDAQPNDQQDFSFTAGGGLSPTSFSLDDDSDNLLSNSRTFNDVTPGSGYSLSESVPAGWTQTGATCDDGSPVSNIAVSAGETVTCTFVNRKDAHIVVDKVTDPAADPQSFNFTATGTGYTSFSLTDAAAPNDQALTPGSYSVAETTPGGWTLTNSSCVSSNGDAETPASISLQAGETVTCTFNNRKDAHIIVDKVTDPAADPQSFNFTATGTGYTSFSLTDAAAPNDQTPVPGSYSVAETTPGGWTLTNSSCVSSKGDAETPAAISLQAGETVTCTFNNRKDGHIIVDKITNPAADPQSFDFTATGTGYTNFSLTDAAAPNDQTVAPGSYAVAETTPGGWTLTGSSCVSSKGDAETPAAISLQAGETVTCTFNNRKDAHIIVDKITNPAADPQSFNFTATGTGYNNFSLTDAAAPNDQTPLPGSYSVAETTPGGWTLTNSSCVSSKGDAETPASISLQAGETVTCTFNNRKDAHIIVDKITNPAGDPQSFNFTATGTGYNNFSLTDAAAPNDQTPLPGSYSVAETTPGGWTLTNSSCVSSKGDAETPAAISLQAGETVTCTFNNRKDAHIIVDKVTDPAADPQSFSFTATGTGYNNFSLTDAAAPNDQTPLPGDYAVAETTPGGWTLTGSSCVSSKGDTETPAAISLQAGETVTCTFNNRKDGHIIVDKVTNPAGDPQSFNFTATGTGYTNFSLTDAAAPNDQTVAPGSYAVAETTPGGWTLTGSSCVSSKGDAETPAAISLQPGETVTCTFNNRKDAHIVVDKITNPAGDPQSFDFTATGTGYNNFSLTDAAAPNDQTALPGNYSVAETTPGGWTLTSSSCVSSKGDTETPAAISLQAGETVTCTFNNRKDAHIIVDKITNPAGDPQSFNFTATGTGYNNFSLTDAAAPNDQTPLPGNYAVAETTPGGWTLTGASCISSKGDAETPAAISLQAGETVTCTFNNRKDAHIIVDKITNPAADPQSFSFTATGTGYNNFSLTDAAAPNDQTPLPGNYAVAETTPGGWTLTSSSCVSSKGDAETPAAISLQAGETVTCTFNNTKSGTITIVKDSVPNDLQDFAFTATGDGLSGFTLDDDGGVTGADATFSTVKTFSNVVPGSKTVTEGSLASFDLTQIVCADPDGGTTRDVANRIANIDLDPGESITCTFTNTKRARILVQKVTLPSPDPSNTSFAFTAGGTGVTPTSFSLKNGESQQLNSLVPGTGYSVAETVPEGWSQQSATCSDGSPIGNISLSAGETVICTFTNRKLGRIIVDKVTLPAASSQSFHFTTTGTGYTAGFDLTDAAAPNQSPFLQPGTYTVSEDAVANWDLTSSTCAKNGGGATAYTNGSNIVIAPGDVYVCTFTNRERGKARVVKTVLNRGTGQNELPAAGQAFTFQLRTGATTIAAGTILETAVANAANGGVINFTTALVPGTLYQVCEVVEPGWMTTLGPPFFAVFNPSGDNSVVCGGDPLSNPVGFTVQPGQTKTFSINNIPPPGGLARTIGFWKNWSSCTGGGQKPKLDQTLAINPILIGDLLLTGTDCVNAVRILDKARIDNGRKMASDPAFNLAAQLLAAKLNIQAGAGACAAAVTAINDAQTILAAVDFNGNTHAKLTTAQANQMNSLAVTLDLYNNNKLCS